MSNLIFNILMSLRLWRLTVHAPNRLTTFKCFPRCCIIFISPIKDVNCDLSTGGFAILIATVETSSPLMIPTAFALICLNRM